MKKIDDYERLFVFDTETTGLEWRTDKLIEIGVLIFEKDDNGSFIEKRKMNYLINHGIEIPGHIIELTGITQQMVDTEGEPQAKVIKEIAPYLLGDTLLIAYNAQFDMNFLTMALREVFNDNGLMLENDVLDPYSIFKDRYGYPHRLENAIKVLGVTGVNSHKAIDDAFATINVLRALMEDTRYDRPDIDYMNVLTYNPKYGQNGLLLPYVRYVPTKGGKGEIYKTIKKIGH